MTWEFRERAGSGRFRFSDDGSASGTIAIVAEWSDPLEAGKRAPAGAGADAQASLVAALDNYFPIGGLPTAPPDFSSAFSTTWGGENCYRVAGYSGAVPTNSDGNVWYVDVDLVFGGDVSLVQGSQSNNLERPRKSVDVKVQTISRRAATYADWYKLTSSDYPTHGDADWSATSTSGLQVGTTNRLDVSGAPIPLILGGARIVVDVIDKYDPSWARAVGVLKTGHRNKEDELGFSKGMVLFEGMDMVQLGHGFARYTCKFYGDRFFHLEQVSAPNGSQGSFRFRDSTEIATDFIVQHAEALWRQPYGLTTATNAWELADIFEFFTTAQTAASLAEYVNYQLGQT